MISLHIATRRTRRVFNARHILPILLLLVGSVRAWGAIATDAIVSTDRSSAGTSITSPTFSTTAANQLLLAFVATDATSAGVTVTGVSGAGLTWVLVRRTNVQLGTAEIWRAFASATLSNVTVRATTSQSVAASITVVSFTGMDTSGTNGSGAVGATGSGNANPGAPTATLIATRSNSWVFGVGNDWDSATSRTTGTNQTMVHQYLASVGDTYWVQRRSAPTAVSGTSVTINDTPTTDRYNLSIVEVLPAGINQAPVVSAGSDQTMTLPTNSVTLTGTATDDGLPSPPGALTYGWSFVSGPGAVAFSAPSALTTVATFPTAGTYAMRLTVSDSALTTAADVHVTVNPIVTNRAPVVSAGSDQTIALPTNSVTLTGTATDDGLPSPPGALTYGWSFVSGPGAVTFSAPSALTTVATLPTAGTYTLRLTVSDSALTTAADVHVIVNLGHVLVTISPKRGGLAIAQPLTVTASVQNDMSNAGVTWSASGNGCSGLACGSFTNPTTTSATYVGPSTAGIYTVTATSIADGTASASSILGVTDLPGVLTYHNNLSRDGTNTSEYALITSAVTTATFGKLFSCQVDGAIYVQPLWVPRVTIGGLPHNVMVVATQHDSVYAFDADANPCVLLWHANLIDAAHGGTSGESAVPSGIGGLVGSGFGDISPEVGVTGTPVVDAGTNRLYVVSKSVKTGNTFFQRLHGLDLTNGNETVAPQSIDAAIAVAGTGDGSVNGRLAFDPRNEHQRPGLVLSNGVVYVSWASHEDHDPYHGWLIGFDASTLAPIANAVFNTTPNHTGTVSYSRGGIWMGGGAPAVDASGNLYLITGNGTFDANTSGSNYGDSVVKLSTSSGIAATDYFTPSTQATLDANDTDFGSGGAAILVDQPTGPVPHLLIGGGKDGNLFLLNRDAMGHFNGSSNTVIQTINQANSIFATPVFWQNSLYVAGENGALNQFVFNPATGKFSGAPSSQSFTTYRFPGATPSLSSNGATNGIVWALDNSQYCTPQSSGCGPAVLHAYDATNLAVELWNSSQAAGQRDQAGRAVKFAVPTVVNGKVYVGTRGNDSTVLGELEVYGLLPNASLDTTPPTVQVNNPAAGATVSATVPISATAADNTAVVNVQFYIDGIALGASLGASPYTVAWDTSTVPDGQHTITARATDTVGLVGFSTPVTITVDNSQLPSVIGKDATVSVDGSGAMRTPAFSITTAGDFLVAFVAYDGPSGSPQTATVSGAGLTWTLLKRSNVQSGTAEIWTAKASGVLSNVTVTSQPGTGTIYHGSMTVIAFTNASGSGVVGQASASSGAPDINLPSVAAGDWVFAVGNDWDQAIARSPVSGQVLVHQRVDTSTGDTFWVQSTSAPASAPASVDIHDSAPTTDRWNYAAVEVVATRK